MYKLINVMEYEKYIVYNRDTYNYLINYFRGLGKHTKAIERKKPNMFLFDFKQLVGNKNIHLLKSTLIGLEIVYEENLNKHTIYNSHHRSKYRNEISQVFLSNELFTINKDTYEIALGAKISIFSETFTNINLTSNKYICKGLKLAKKRRLELIEDKKQSTIAFIEKHTKMLNYLNSL